MILWLQGCSGPDIDTDYGCKKLPVGPPPWKGCNNMAWIFNPNGTIVSAMPSVTGGALDQCLQVSDKDNITVMLGLCSGAESEVWSVKGTAIESSLGTPFQHYSPLSGVDHKE